jgi:hypothetical protein
VFLDLPASAATSLLTAETYISGRPADLTFRTRYIDFPAGPVPAAADTSFATIGDFLAGALIEDLSSPARLEEPFGDFVIRFRGYVDVRLAHSTLGLPGLPVLLDFATFAHGGYRTRIGATSIYRVQDSQFLSGPPLFTENALVLATGMFPMTVTYLQRFDPNDAFGNALAGIELYSFHPGGLPAPAGAAIVDPVFGPMTITPPEVIYQPEQLAPPPHGDADGDKAVTLRDVQALQLCAGESPGGACGVFDFTGDGLLGADDMEVFARVMRGPARYPFLPGDYIADNRIDLRDIQWLQTCFTSGGGEEAPGVLPTDCILFDTDHDGDVDLLDYAWIRRILHGPLGL